MYREKPPTKIDPDTDIKEHLSLPAPLAETKYLSCGDVCILQKYKEELIFGSYARKCA